MRIKLIILVIVFSLFFSAYTAFCLTLTEKDSGSAVTLKSGQDLQITLPSNPSTGYSWNIISIDTVLLKQIGEEEYTQEINRLGGGGHTTFRFKAAGEGKFVLKLAYYRAWEKNPSHEKTFTLTVEVK